MGLSPIGKSASIAAQALVNPPSHKERHPKVISSIPVREATLSFQVVFRRLMVGFAVPDWASTKLDLAAWPKGSTADRQFRVGKFLCRISR
jgi:hypothetical protein